MSRIDFYSQKGESLLPEHWIGSFWGIDCIEGIPLEILAAETSEEYEKNVLDFLLKEQFSRIDFWPWPWETSRISDYAFLFKGDRVFVSGATEREEWLSVEEGLEYELKGKDKEERPSATKVPINKIIFPNMLARRNPYRRNHQRIRASFPQRWL